MQRTFIATAIGLLCASAPAKYARVDTKEVPIARVLKNLEAQPKSFDTLVRRARLHAMAYATGSTNVNVRTDDPDQVFEGYVPPNAPYDGEKKPSAARRRPALDQAVALYREALALYPDEPVAQLGLGWCLLEKGDRTAARASLEKAFEKAWGQTDRSAYVWRRAVLAEEIAGYLRPLLDPKKDAPALAELDRRVVELEKIPRKITPILLPVGQRTALDALVDRNARQTFDLDGAAPRCRWQWITDDAAWLVWAPQGRGPIRSGLQLFGNVTFWIFWNDGYEALCSLDDDGDGAVAGSELEHLALWYRDGRIVPAARAGITSLRCDRSALVKTTEALAHPRGVRFRDGREIPTYDWMPRCR